MLPWLGHELVFPAPETALEQPSGLLAVGGDLSVERLLLAYSNGIFPWFSPQDPILWWSPPQRMVLYPQQLKVSRSLDKTLRNRRYDIRFDHDFRAVIEACAVPRGGQLGTWIVPEMVEAYCQLARQGFAHSCETWIDGQLVGGLYGVALGRMFFGESMFSRSNDASKLALVHLARHLGAHGFEMIDCQMHTAHLASLGATLIPRATFLTMLRTLSQLPQAANLWSKHICNEPS